MRPVAIGLLLGLPACVPGESPPSVEGPECDDGLVLDERDRCVPPDCADTAWGSVPDAKHVALWGGGVGANGSPEAPYASLTRALDVHDRGAVHLFLDVGEYQLGEDPLADLVPHDGLTLEGRCRDGVVLRAHDGSDSPFTPAGRGMLLRRLTLSGGQYPGRVQGIPGRPAEVTFEEVLMENGTSGGMVVDFGSTVIGRDLEIRNSGSSRPTGCVLVWLGSSVELERADLHDCREYGVRIEGAEGHPPSRFVGREVTIRNILPALNAAGVPNASGGIGVGVFGDTDFELSQSSIQETHYLGLLSKFRLYASPRVTLRDVEVSEITDGSNQANGIGIALTNTDVLAENVSIHDVSGPGLYLAATGGTVTGLEVERSRFAGVLAGGVPGDPTGLRIEDSVIRDIARSPAHGGGVGVMVRSAPVELVDLRVERTASAALYVMDTDAIVSGLEAVDVAPGWAASMVASGGRLELRGATLEGPVPGILYSEAGGVLEDIVFTEPPASPLRVESLRCEDAGSVEVARFDGADPECVSELELPDPRPSFPLLLGEVDIEP